MNGLTWMALNWRNYLGISGAAGVLALLAAVLAGVLWLQPQASERRQLQTALQEAAHRPLPVANQTTGLRLKDFYRQYPHLNTAPDWLDDIDRKLDAHHLTLKQTDYKLIRERNTPLLRYQLTLPVSGHYLEIRALLQELRQSMPFLLVDELAFERDSAAQGTVQARIRVSLMLGGS